MRLSATQRSIATAVVAVGLVVFARWGPAPCRTIARWLVLALLATRIAAALPAALRRVAGQKDAGAPWRHAIGHLLSPSIRGMSQVESSIYAEALCVLARRTLPSAERMARTEGGVRYTLHRGLVSTVFLPLVLLSSVVELPLLHLLIHVQVPEPHRLALHAALFGLTLWGVVWSIGDRSAVKNMAHLLRRDDVALHVGFRASCRLPLAAVKQIQVVTGRSGRWEQMLAAARPDSNPPPRERSDVAVLSPRDRPNILIELRPDRRDVQLVRFGIDRDAPRYLAVYVDRPDAFRQAVLAARQREATAR